MVAISELVIGDVDVVAEDVEIVVAVVDVIVNDVEVIESVVDVAVEDCVNGDVDVVEVVSEVDVTCPSVVDIIDEIGSIVAAASHTNSKSHIRDGGVSDNSMQSESIYLS